MEVFISALYLCFSLAFSFHSLLLSLLVHVYVCLFCYLDLPGVIIVVWNYFFNSVWMCPLIILFCTAAPEQNALSDWKKSSHKQLDWLQRHTGGSGTAACTLILWFRAYVLIECLSWAEQGTNSARVGALISIKTTKKLLFWWCMRCGKLNSICSTWVTVCSAISLNVKSRGNRSCL